MEEGSYAEPNTEYGLGMYNAIREELCYKPEDGWPVNIAPQDIGIGPMIFRNHCAGQRGIGDFNAGGGALRLILANHDPAIGTLLAQLRAGAFNYNYVHMKADANTMAQLFWTTTTSGIRGAASVVSLPSQW